MPSGMPASGMRGFAALAGLSTLWAISGCFNVDYGHCRITCKTNSDCPSSLTCVMEEGTERGLCAPPGTTTCPSFQEPDAGADADAVDAGEDAGGDAMDGGDAGPPEVLCHNGNTCRRIWPAPSAPSDHRK